MFNNQKRLGALRKAWRGYSIVKNKHELDNMEYYASIIQKLQRELGLKVSSFPDIGLPDNNDDINNIATTQEQDVEEERLRDSKYSPLIYYNDDNNALSIPPTISPIAAYYNREYYPFSYTDSQGQQQHQNYLRGFL
jgi:hypothetical protein